MVPLEDNMYFTQNESNIGLGRSDYVYEDNSAYVNEQKSQSSMVQKEFTEYLEKMKATLTQEEYRKLLVWAYQGCDLRYKKIVI